MSWSPVISSDNVVAIHAILVPTVNGDGEILIVGGDNHSYAGNNPGPPVHHDYDHSRRFNCRTGNMITSPVVTPDFDLFCCGHAFLGDGRPLLAGGTAEFPADAAAPHHAHNHFDGHRHSAIYNYISGTLNQAADMNGEPGLTTGGGRWYPTLCTIGNGDVFIFQGHPRGDDGRHGNNTAERFQLTSGNWKLLPAVGTITSDPILYPRLHLIKDGKIFVSSSINGYSQNIKVNPLSAAVQPISPLPDAAYHGFDYPSVLLALHPSDNYAARILLCGGPTSQIINLDDASPGWTTVPRDGHATGTLRSHACATLLPTGQVALTGGSRGFIADGDPNNDQLPVPNPELYDPVTNQWHTVTDPATVLRNYHSTALLMPDGNVWTAGGNSPGQPGTPPTANQKKIEIFHPPYPAGPRPVISYCPPSASYGKSITLSVPNASNIASVVLMRCGSSTHACNPDQRAVYLNFDYSATSASLLTAGIPANPNVAVPGPYMLFVVDIAGRPCQYAKFIRIGFQSCNIITDRSTFSALEVEAQPAGNALFQRAFYVVYDGFLPAELENFANAPEVRFNYAGSGGGVVHGMTAALADIEFEDASVPPDVPQKLTFVFDVTFTTHQPFDFTEAMRNVRITAILLQNECSAVVNLIKAPNPYMVDGPTSWLSVDLRVFRIREGQGKAGIVQHASGNDFIAALLDRFNLLPDNDYHPFKSITTDQEDSRLELSETVGGVHVFNYAVAKVRYKAPIPIPPANNDAHDVKVFFRLFNTAGTAMQYNPATTYRRAGTGANTISLIGKEGGAISSIPFFAAPRRDYAAVSMTTQTDTKNKQTLPANNSTETVRYFGCWLDINRNVPLLPLHPATDGPFTADRKSIQELIRGVHQCLVAEVYFEGDPTPAGATPASSDNLSQRNLVIVPSDNPGNKATHTVQHTFEIKPSQFKCPSDYAPDGTAQKLFAASAVFDNLKREQITGPDWLIVHHALPPESELSVYLPDLAVDDVTALESFTRLSPSKIDKEDEHTLRLTASEVSYVPIPGGLDKNIPGLLTVALPSTVTRGQRFTIIVQQARYYENSLRIIGSFQVNIPVKTAPEMLTDEMRTLAVLKHIHNAIPATDSWYLIFNKYLKGLSDKIDGLGGDAGSVPASPDDRWLDYKNPLSARPEIPNNLTDVVNSLKNTIRCIGEQSQTIGCIRVKSITLELKFKDDC